MPVPEKRAGFHQGFCTCGWRGHVPIGAQTFPCPRCGISDVTWDTSVRGARQRRDVYRAAMFVALKERCPEFFQVLRRDRQELAHCRLGSGEPIETFVKQFHVDTPWMHLAICDQAAALLTNPTSACPKPDLVAAACELTDSQLCPYYWFVEVQVNGETETDVAELEGVARQLVAKRIQLVAKRLMLPIRPLPKTGRTPGVKDCKPRHIVRRDK
jgi:hypothetical protein